MRGACDCCDRTDVRLTRCWVYGIETAACAVCRGWSAEEAYEEELEAVEDVLNEWGEYDALTCGRDDPDEEFHHLYVHRKTVFA